MGAYLRPETIEDALDALHRGSFTIVAGGTDFYPARVGNPIDEDVLDLSGLMSLRGITRSERYIHIGATTTWTDVLRADLPPYFRGLKLAAREIGGVQIQNTGTVCGNICNASPAADGVPPLLSLAAEVELVSREGARRLPLAQFITGNRETARRPNELLTGLHITRPSNPARAGFAKFGARKYLVISIVMAAVLLEQGNGNTVAAARVAIGACSAVAQRLPALEAALVGLPISSALSDVVEPSQFSELTPVDDMRGSAGYRNEAAVVLVRRLLRELGGEV